MKVETALSFLQNRDVDQKKFKHLLKEAGKLFSTVGSKQAETKTKQKTIASKKAPVKKQATSKASEIKKD